MPKIEILVQEQYIFYFKQVSSIAESLSLPSIQWQTQCLHFGKWCGKKKFLYLLPYHPSTRRNVYHFGHQVDKLEKRYLGRIQQRVIRFGL